MSKATFTRPDGRAGTYGEWAAEMSAKWRALSATEQAESRALAAGRLAARVRAEGAGPAQMHLYDEIGWFGVHPADVVSSLAGIKGDVEVHLNSPGGDVFDGMAIYAALRDHPGKVSVVVDGLAASAASFIAMAADPGPLAMTPNGTMMIHDAWGGCVGPASDMAAMAELLDRTSDNIAAIYASRGGRTAPEYRDLMKAETWAVGQEAVNLGLADSVRGGDGSDGGQAGPVTVTASWQVTIQAAPEPAAGPRNAAVDDSDWDGPAAMSAASKADDPAAALGAICAGKRDGDPKTQAAHALPHHKHPGAAPNAAGVKNALGRLPQTQGLTNEDAAKAHLEAHMKAINPDYEPSDHAEMPAWLRNA